MSEPDQARVIPPPECAKGVADATIREAAAELRCAPSTIWRLIHRSEIEAYKTGARVKITRPSIDALKVRNRIQAKGAA